MKDWNSSFARKCLPLFLWFFLALAGLVSGTDTTPPTIPTNFSVVVTSCSRVDLAWASATDPKGSQSGLAGYKIYRNNVLVSTLGLTTTFSDTSVAGNSTYNYRVSAIDISGNESSQSTAILVAPCADSTAPSIPSSLAPTVVSPNQIDLSWGGVTDGAGKAYEAISGLKSYQVFRNGTNANNKIAEVSAPATSYSDGSFR